jgi:hypothetical protein
LRARRGRWATARRDKASLRSFLTLEVCFEVFLWKNPMVWIDGLLLLPSVSVLLDEQEGEYFSLSIYIYYNEWRKLKFFLTQIRSDLPLTSDPPIICFWKQIRWKTMRYQSKITIWRVFLKKRFIFLTELACTRPPYPLGPHSVSSTRLSRFFLPSHPFRTTLIETFFSTRSMPVCCDGRTKNYRWIDGYSYITNDIKTFNWIIRVV